MSKLINQISYQNKHWNGNDRIIPKYERELLTRVWNDIDTKLMALITGPRRVGKSIVLKQIINKLIKGRHISPKQILFYEFEPNQNVNDLWDIFYYFTQNVADPRLPTYLFFDEIQYLENFESTIKNIYDNQDQTKIFLTGSLSLSYKHRMHESLAGRFFSYTLYPLKFKEYLALFVPNDEHVYDEALKETDRFKKQYLVNILNPHFRQFLEFGRFPELSTLVSVQTKDYLQSILNQSLNQDVFTYFGIQKPLLISSLFEYLRVNNGGIISSNKISSLLGGSNQTVTEYLNILEIMGLIYPVYNTTNSLIKLNSLKKIYVNSAFALLDTKYDQSTTVGFAVESYILERLLEKGETVTFWRKREKEVDFILPKKNLGYEVKFRPNSSEVKQIVKNFDIELISLNGKVPACLF